MTKCVAELKGEVDCGLGCCPHVNILTLLTETPSDGRALRISRYINTAG